MKKETVADLLQAETYKASALWTMQENISEGEYEGAMERQFEYLYWHDEAVRLHRVGELSDERWKLVLRAHGV